METNQKDVSALLPWHVNGTLDGAARRKVDEATASSPALLAEAAWLKSVRNHIQNDDRDALPAPDAGLDKLMARIAGEQSGKVVSLQRPATGLAKWYKPALAIAASVIIAQGVVLEMMTHHGATLTTASGEKATLQITFKPNATEAQIRETLASINGEIVGGPGALGIYKIDIRNGDEQAVLTKLQQQKNIVESASLPAR
jgi:hypothetical protein